MSVSPRTLTDALNEAPMIARRLVPYADDAAILMRQSLSSGSKGSFNPSAIPDAKDAKAAKKALHPSLRSAAASSAAVAHYANRHREEVGRAGGFFETLDPLVNMAETVGQTAFMVDAGINFGLPLVGWALGFLGLPNARNFVRKPHDYLNPPLTPEQEQLVKEKKLTPEKTLGNKITDKLMIGMSALSIYGVARSFSQQMNSLKHMYADITGTPVERLSTMSLLTMADVPPVVAAARSHLIKEHLARAAGQIGGLGWMWHVINKKDAGHLENMASIMLPQFADMGINALMGESILPTYTGFANAYKSGQAIPPEAYAEFILAASSDLKTRKVGRQVAHELGTQYANEKINPGEILKQMNDGRFKARIDVLIAKDEAELARQKALKAKTAPQENGKAHAAGGGPSVSMVDRLSGHTPKREKVGDGKFTGMVAQESAARTPTV